MRHVPNTPDELAAVRVVIATLGLDQHEAGAIAVARILRDAGMTVIYLGRFQLPEQIINAAVAESADVIGLSVHSWEYRYYIDDIFRGLRGCELEIPIIVGGSILTPTDHLALTDEGVFATFDSSATAEDIVNAVQRARRERPQL